MAIDEEQVDYQIRIEAAEALKSLEQITATASSLPEVLQAVERAVQGLADKFGISFNAAQAEMKDTIKLAEAFRVKMEELSITEAQQLSFSPYLTNLMQVQSPFGEMGDAAGWKAVNDARREATALNRDVAKSEAAIAKEVNTEAAAREKAVEAILKEVAAQDMLENTRIAKQMDAEAAAKQKAINAIQQEIIAQDNLNAKLEIEARLSEEAARQKAISAIQKGVAAQDAEETRKAVEQQQRSIQATQNDILRQEIVARKAAAAQKEMNSEIEKTEPSTRRALTGINALRIAMGALVAMILFRVVQAIGQLKDMFITGMGDAELATNNLIDAERRLSQQGVEITPKDFDEFVAKVQKLDPLISKLEATKIVSDVATRLGATLNLTKDQMDSFITSMTALSVRARSLGKDTSSIFEEGISAILSGRISKGLNDLGVNISNDIVAQKAFAMHLVATADGFNKLDGETKKYVQTQVILKILEESTADTIKHLPEYFKGADSLFGIFQARLQDLMSLLGEKFTPVLKQILTGSIDLLTKIIDSVQRNSEAWKLWGTIFTAIAYSVKTLIEWFTTLVLWLGKVETAFVHLIEKVPFLQKMLDYLFKTAFPDTPTITPKVDNQDALKSLNELKQKIEDVKQDMINGVTDLRTNLLRKLADINLEYARKAEDAHTDYLQKLEDIDRKYAQNVNDIKKKQREQDKKDEEKYQLELWELQQRYLMNLEDALHARDARQILRLQRQYAFDKEDAARKHALDTKNREQDQKAELDDAKKKADEARAQAKLEYQRKLEDQKIAKQRELADLQTWYLREFRDLQESIKRKLQALIESGIKEQTITQKNAAAVYGILKSYFGPGGMTDQLYAYMAQSLAANAQAATAALATGINQYGGVGNTPYGPPRPPSTGSTGGSSGGRNRAEGGVMIASRPTNVTFGEAGAEAALFLPMNKIGRNSGRVDFNGGGGMDGTIVVRLDLSPDLEARVVESSMNGVANIVTKINRTKV